jgi:dihydrofolate reductase
MALCESHADVWVIGGAQIYAQALPLATSAEITEIDISPEGDAFAPVFGPEWLETRRENHVAASGLGYSLVRLERN